MEKTNEIKALSVMAERLAVEPMVLKDTLKNTVIKKATDAEFMAFIIIANTYKLNPLMKEMYAFPDKNGGVIPIVSTDGWNKIMQNNPDYKSHYYVESEEVVTLPKAKPCPTWMEIHIQKKDGSETVVREYLDECFRDINYTSPWQTHTKRMLRHKTKIQGAREAFGLGGIYDEDEAERIIEAQVELPKSTKPVVAMPQEVKKDTVEEKVEPKDGLFTYDDSEPIGESTEVVEQAVEVTEKAVTPTPEDSKKALQLIRDAMAKCKTIEELKNLWEQEMSDYKTKMLPEDYEKATTSKNYFKKIAENKAKVQNEKK